MKKLSLMVLSIVLLISTIGCSTDEQENENVLGFLNEGTGYSDSSVTGFPGGAKEYEDPEDPYLSLLGKIIGETTSIYGEDYTIEPYSGGLCFFYDDSRIQGYFIYNPMNGLDNTVDTDVVTGIMNISGPINETLHTDMTMEEVQDLVSEDQFSMEYLGQDGMYTGWSARVEYPEYIIIYEWPDHGEEMPDTIPNIVNIVLAPPEADFILPNEPGFSPDLTDIIRDPITFLKHYPGEPINTDCGTPDDTTEILDKWIKSKKYTYESLSGSITNDFIAWDSYSDVEAFLEYRGVDEVAANIEFFESGGLTGLTADADFGMVPGGVMLENEQSEAISVPNSIWSWAIPGQRVPYFVNYDIEPSDFYDAVISITENSTEISTLLLVDPDNHFIIRYLFNPNDAAVMASCSVFFVEMDEDGNLALDGVYVYGYFFDEDSTGMRVFHRESYTIAINEVK